LEAKVDAWPRIVAPYKILYMTVRNIARQIFGAFVAVFTGWFAAVVFEEIVTAIYLWIDPISTRPEQLYSNPMISGLFMSFWIVPTWLLALVPLYLFVPTSSVLWRPAVCTPCGAVAGIVIAWPFFHPMWGVDSADFAIWNPFILAAIVGGITRFTGAVTRDRFKRTT
jgi:hypothetical protein